MNAHPYIRYAQALIMSENNLTAVEEISLAHIKAEIEKGLNTFCVKPIEDIEGKQKVKYTFSREKNNAPNCVFLSPNVISSDMQAKNIFAAATKFIDINNTSNLSKIVDIGMSDMPITGEFLVFSEQGNISRGNPKATILEQGLALVTSLTPEKPCLQYRIDKQDRPEMFNVCIIPDLSLESLISFIRLFKQMKVTQTNDLMKGNVVAAEVKNKKGDDTIVYSPKRPLIYNGNFPNPPKSSALGSIALLGTMGEFVKNAEYSELAIRVLDDLKGSAMYMIKYGSATTFTYNHYVVELAKASKLKSVVDSMYYSQLYNQDRRKSKNTEYQKFDLFTSRFLQLFSNAAFKDFLAFRAEYPNPVGIILNTYFIKMEKIDSKIVASARQLGKWLNLVAYLAAKSEVKDNEADYETIIRNVKAKVLIELESSTFAAKTGDALIAQVITRAGRLSGLDAPESAALFMEQTASGELPLEKAKNLLIAFSRLKNKIESREQPLSATNESGEEETEEIIDLSNE